MVSNTIPPPTRPSPPRTRPPAPVIKEYYKTTKNNKPNPPTVNKNGIPSLEEFNRLLSENNSKLPDYLLYYLIYTHNLVPQNEVMSLISKLREKHYELSQLVDKYEKLIDQAESNHKMLTQSIDEKHESVEEYYRRVRKLRQTGSHL